MNIFTNKRKPPVVPIISLIDILTILLIFFIATSTFKKSKPAVDIEPPLPGTLTTRPIDEDRTTLAVSADNQFYLGAEPKPIAAAALVGRLRSVKASGEKLELKADGAADFEAIVKALDSLKKAGYKKGDYPTILKLSQDEGGGNENNNFPDLKQP